MTSFLILRRASAFSINRGNSRWTAEKRFLATLSSDQSAASHSSEPFRMPRQSPNDSSTGSVWNQLGLWTELTDCIDNELQLASPTAVQSLVLPHLLKDEKQNVAFLAATGSGKLSSRELHYCLFPCLFLMQQKGCLVLALTISSHTSRQNTGICSSRYATPQTPGSLW